MKAINFVILACVVCLCSCKDTGSKQPSANGDTIASMKMATDTNVITAAIDSTHTAQNSFNWKGTYTGIMPCADCKGIETKIMLHADNTYMVSVKYSGKNGEKEMNTEGKFTWINGSAIQLEALKDVPSIYAVAENKLIQLDNTGKRNEGVDSAKYILTKN